MDAAILAGNNSSNNGEHSSRGRRNREFPETKVCGCCHRLLRVVLNQTFNRNRSGVMPDGLQVNCRACDERRKAEKPEYAWSALRRYLKDKEPGSLWAWTERKYFDIVCGPGPERELTVCHYCGNSLKLWGKGHKLDRIDSKRGHVPDNCVACCSGCNWAKGSMNPNAWDLYIKDVLSRYPEGKVPWQTIDPKGPKPVEIPDLSAYELRPQLDLPLVG